MFDFCAWLQRTLKRYVDFLDVVGVNRRSCVLTSGARCQGRVCFSSVRLGTGVNQVL